MNTSILETIKLLLGLDTEQTDFDNILLVHINTAIATLTQLGVGLSSGYRVDSPDDTWSDYIGDDNNYAMIKDYIFLKVKMYFDPPSSGTLVEAIKTQLSELEFRINTVAEYGLGD